MPIISIWGGSANLFQFGGVAVTYFNLGGGITYFNLGGGEIKKRFQPLTPPLFFSGIAVIDLFIPMNIRKSLYTF